MKTSLKKLTCLFLSILMVMAVAITGVSAATVDENPTAEAQTIYVDVSGITGDYVYAAWKWTTGDGAWYTFTDNGTYLETTMEVGENIIIAALNAGTATPDWSAKVYQTDNITDYNGTNNLLVCTSGGSQGIAYTWANYSGGEVSTTEPTTLETLPPVTIPTPAASEEVEESTLATFATEPDEDANLYVVAQSNLETTGVKTKTTGNLISVTYSLKADQIIEDGQAVITYDATKLAFSAANNTEASMFPTVTGVKVNTGSATGEMMFNFSGVQNADFTDGAVLVNVVFERKYNAVGTTAVYLNVTDLSSKETTYVEDGVVKSAEGITVTPAVATATAAGKPSQDPVETDANTNIKVRVSTNLNEDSTEINVDKSNVKVTFKLTVAEAVAFGNAIVTFDESMLALEHRFNTMDTLFTTITTGAQYNLNAAPGTMKFAFAGVDATNKKGLFNFANGGELVTLTFTVKAGATGVADIKLYVENLGAVLKDYIADGELAEGVEGSVNGVAEQATPSPTDPTETPLATGNGPTNPNGGATDPSESTDPSTTPSTDPSTTPSTDPSTEPSTTPTQPKPVLTVASKVAPGKTTTAKVANATGTVKYSTSSKKIATIDSKGVITGLKKGTVTITAVANGVTLTKKVQITADPTVKFGKKVLKNKDVIVVKKGKKLTLKITGKASKIANKVTLKSSKIGKITSKNTAAKVIMKAAKKAGSSKLIIKINGVKKYTFTVKVK